ncbi:hypothetical protein [Algisphaera agarilytica]|uniref:Uncharacterized protein n=1 Tax=Algisphaera agarilytica TaxID=1385975 RepID=A0A7X0LKB1_9BACT|nr:hypothetical protein [Algisphaera agarilytica]MBB6429659.1 hypothetical protein [Algisphaera agarilytica]
MNPAPVITVPKNINGIPTKQHQKYFGGPDPPNAEKKLTNPIAMNVKPATKTIGPTTRSTLRIGLCVSRINPGSWGRRSYLIK